MSAQTAIEILDSMFDLFKQMGSGIALDLQWLEISRRLQQVRVEADWSADLDFVAVKLKAHAAYYVSAYQPHADRRWVRDANTKALDQVVIQYSILRAHLEQRRDNV